MTHHWLDKAWDYKPAASHADGAAFRRRQRERMRAAEVQRKAAPTKVTTLKRREAAK